MPSGVPPGIPQGLWNAMCKTRLSEIHRSHGMTPDEKETRLRSREFVAARPPAGRSLKLMEDPTGCFGAGTSGAVLWPAATALIEHLDTKIQASLLGGTRALELGAGLGAVGLFLALHKGCDVVVTELPESLPLLLRNVAENFPAGDGPQAVPLSWGDEEQMGTLGSFDLVVGSDVTYRPDCLIDLLATAARLLRPGGKLCLSLQDRPGEEASLENALSQGSRAIRSNRPFRVVSRIATVVKSPLAPELAGGDDDGNEGDHTIIIYELTLDDDDAQVAAGRCIHVDTGAAPTTAEEVEAEFFRLTGIRPEPLVMPARPKPTVEPKKTPGPSLGERYRQEMEKLGLSDRLDKARNPIAFDPAAIMAASAESWPGQGGTATPTLLGSEPEDKKEKGTKASVMSASEKETSQTSGARALKCMSGLDWNVEVEQEQLSANVTFSFDLWRNLCGVTGCEAFKEAVSFELAAEELRVLHAGSVVLDLQLPSPVDATRAVASISSKKMRVAVKAPLQGSGKDAG
eukprot:TRINITY_DN24205_c0_g2_i1.p1 TRINITY_DN24205_c0_g2~~TRINITY_DN24205_c0_g2_i1.p1  ORF type:complete len:557 (+),score=125.29 TRINITY_DN24205_c0_g2_i1:121-1671(+)